MKTPFNQTNPFDEGLASSKVNRTAKKSKREKPAYKGISRIDSDHNHTHGWYVRVRQNGTVRSKFFSDQKHGGVAKALMKARRFYKNQMKEVVAETLGEVPEKLPNRVIVTKNRNNNTGVVGVQLVERRNPGGSLYRAYRVCWSDKSGKSHTKFFSIKKLGREEAFQLARQYRKEKLLED